MSGLSDKAMICLRSNDYLGWHDNNWVWVTWYWLVSVSQ